MAHVNTINEVEMEAQKTKETLLSKIQGLERENGLFRKENHTLRKTQETKSIQVRYKNLTGCLLSVLILVTFDM